MKLYEIDGAILSLLATADESGELNDAVATELDNLAMDRTDKIEGICKVIRTAQGREAAIQAEIDRLQMAKRRETSAVDWLKNYLKSSMLSAGDKKIEAGTFTVRIQKNSAPSISVMIDAEKLPEQFRRVIVEPAKDEILKAWRANGAVPDGVTIEVGQHLRIA